MKAILDEQQRVELRHNIKRGQRDTVRQGRSPGGIAYGYRTANVIDATGRPVRGLRVIDPDQAKVVQRIFEEYAAGLSPVKIAQRLNHEGIPGPRGDRWRATTVRPDRSRGNGLLQNQFYIGRIVNNRTSKIVEPVTRKTRIRPNPEAEWVVQEAPNLRIIDQDLWDRVQQGLRRVQGHPPVKTRRERHLLSGLGLCGMCGGSWTIQTSVYWGCSSRKEGSNCSNGRSISTEHYQRPLLRCTQRSLRITHARSANFT